MKITKNIGFLLLGIWLIITGLFPFLNFGFSGQAVVMDSLAIAAGVLIIVGR